MAMKLYNSLSRTKETLTTREPGKVSMYVCGPTVYSDCHVGHLMGPLLFDAVARWMAQRGYDVRFLNNITDIDDKIIDRARNTGEDWRSITERYTQQYLDFLATLGVKTVTDHPKATDFMPQMIAYIGKLVDDGMAYATPDGVYFEVSKKDGYGKLSGRRVEEMKAGARIDRDDGLHHPADFALWKRAKEGEPSWESPWGPGRPGWHIECSVMTHSLLGDSFDIHGGGDDLKFPHHENEIAQGEAHGGSYAQYWMHNGLIQYEGSKISKSDPRNADPAFADQFKAANLLDTWGAATIRFFFLQGHYRRPFDFAPSHLQSARAALTKLHKQLGDLMDSDAEASLEDILSRSLGDEAARRRQAFCDAMDDDFNTGAAIGHLFAIAGLARQAKGAEAQALLELLRDLGRLLGCFSVGDGDRVGLDSEDASGGADVAPLLDLLVELRQQARANRDFAAADLIRNRLTELGWSLEDGPDGTSWHKA
jgi:cysteinyl-tRNA synthetase